MTNKMIDDNTVYIPEWERVLPGVKSGDDRIAIVLKAEDWRRIAQELRLDADAEGLGPAEAAVQADFGTDDYDELEVRLAAAHARDGQDVACHDCSSATERCAAAIETTLNRYDLGWDL
jgi:hypothetical protein